MFLFANILPDGFFVATNGRDPGASGPNMLPREIARASCPCPGKRDRALPCEESHGLGNGIFRRNRQKHGHMIWHQMPFYDLTCFPPSEAFEHRSEIFAECGKQFFLALFRNPDQMVLTFPRGVTSTLEIVHTNLPVL
jgi:hypothetical protein